MNNSPVLPRSARETADRQIAHIPGPVSQDPCMAAGRVLRALSGVIRQLARQLIAANTPHAQPPVRLEQEQAVLSVLLSNCLLQPALLEMMNAVLPAGKNPITALNNAQNIDELLASQHGLKQMLGTNQSGKLDFSGIEQADPADIPVNLLKTFLRKAPASQQALNQLPIHQRDQLAAFATWVAEFAGSHSPPIEIVARLGMRETQQFLMLLARPGSNAYVTGMRQALGLRIVRENGLQLEGLPHDLRDNQAIVEQAIINNPNALGFASQALQDNPHIVKLTKYRSGVAQLQPRDAQQNVDNPDTRNPLMVMAAVWHNGLALEEASAELRNNPDIVLAAVRQNILAFQHASAELRGNPEFVLAVVWRNGFALQFVGEEFQADHEIVLAAVRHTGFALQYANAELRSNPEIVLAAVQYRGSLLEYASAELQANPEIVLAAVWQDGEGLEFASQELQGNRQIVLATVRENGWALQYASEELRGDREIVMTAVQRAGGALQFASDELRNNPEIVLAAVRKNTWALQFASEELRDNREIVLTAIQHHGWALQFASEALRNDHEIVMAAVWQNGEALRFASEVLRNDREIVMTAVQQYRGALYSASEALRNDPLIIQIAGY